VTYKVKGPWDNPVIPAGSYDAVIRQIDSGAYGKDDGIYFRIELWVVQRGCWLVTNIYARKGALTSAERRIWHLCQACNEPHGEFHRRLKVFRGKHLRVTVVTVPASRSKLSRAYSDVDRFLKPTRSLADDDWATYHDALNPTTTPKNKVDHAAKRKRRRLRFFKPISWKRHGIYNIRWPPA